MAKAWQSDFVSTEAEIKETLLMGEKEEVVELFTAIRASLERTVPEAKSKIARSWRALLFHHPEAGYFCGIFLNQGQVKVVLEWGRYLNLPEFFSTKQQIGFWQVDSLQSFRRHEKLFAKALLESVKLTKPRSKADPPAP